MRLTTNRREIDLSAHTHVMGILNVTPDSFWVGGRFVDTEEAVNYARSLVDAGADIIDVGGESTRPSAEEVPADEEIGRVIPVIRAIHSTLGVPISIDTYKSDVARAAVEAGAEIVNDISGFAFDPNMASVVAASGAACVITHSSPNRETMHTPAGTGNIVREVAFDLAQKVDRAIASGVARGKIVIDPGIGFGKSLSDDLLLHTHLNEINTYNLPVLFASSRKKFIGNLLNLAAEDRLPATIASCIIALAHGAHLLRVHDVREVVQATRLFDAIKREQGENL